MRGFSLSEFVLNYLGKSFNPNALRSSQASSPSYLHNNFTFLRLLND